MITWLNVNQLQALAEIPKNLVVDCNGEPDGTIYFTKVNKSAVSYYDIIRYLDWEKLKNQSPPKPCPPARLFSFAY